MRIASIGLGRWGHQLAAAAVKSGAEVAGCYAPSEASRQKFAEAFGCPASASVPELLERPDIEAVAIATPHSTHAEIAVAAAAAGKHVFVEKPLALTLEDALRVIAATDAAGVTLQVGHNRRRTSAVRRIKGLLDDGELGRVLLAEGSTARPMHLLPWFTGWRDDRDESPLGGMTAVGVHVVDNFLYLLGPIERVFARSAKLLDDGGLDDVTVLMLEFASGAIGTLATSVRLPPTFSMKLYGSEAAVWTSDTRAQRGGGGSRLYLQSVQGTDEGELEIDEVDPLVKQFEEFVHCARTGATPETGGAAGLAVVGVMAAAGESVATGRPVETSVH